MTLISIERLNLNEIAKYNVSEKIKFPIYFIQAIKNKTFQCNYASIFRARNTGFIVFKTCLHSKTNQIICYTSYVVHTVCLAYASREALIALFDS